MNFLRSNVFRFLSFLLVTLSFLGVLMVYIDNFRTSQIQILQNSIQNRLNNYEILVKSFSRTLSIHNSLKLKLIQPLQTQVYHFEQQLPKDFNLFIHNGKSWISSFEEKNLPEHGVSDFNVNLSLNNNIYIFSEIVEDKKILGKFILEIPYKSLNKQILAELDIPFYFYNISQSCNLSTDKCFEIGLSYKAYISILILTLILCGVFSFGILLLLGIVAKSFVLEQEKHLLTEKIYIARMVKHDIRSPLMALQVLLDDLGVSQEKKGFLKTITERIQQIINSLHSLEEYSTDQLRDKQVFLIDLLQSIVKEKELESKNMGKNITFEISFFNDEVVVKGNEGILYRILSNLINNSINAIEHSGDIYIKLWSRKGNANISIEDTGKGIPKDKIAKVFEYGFSNSDNGTGLGLYNARREIEQVGGKIKIESEINIGTKVKISMRAS